MVGIRMQTSDIPLDMIDVSEFNTRKDLVAGTEDSGLEELARSIQEKGLLSPVVVRRSAKRRFELIIGQRRFLACRKLGLETIPALVRENLDDTDALALSLIENVHRADMNPMDKAKALGQLAERYDHNVARVAKETGLSETTVRRYADLLRLPEEIQERVSTLEGPAKVETLSTLTKTFELEVEMVQAYDLIAGFTQSVQKAILQESGGNLRRIPDLVSQAMEGAFRVYTCRGFDGCFYLSQLPSKGRLLLSKYFSGEWTSADGETLGRILERSPSG